MNKQSNSLGRITVTSGNGYTASELARLNLPGYPVSRKGWYERARRENWEIREEPGNGPGGLVQRFIPPASVEELIQSSAALGPSGLKVEEPHGHYDVADPSQLKEMDSVVAVLGTFAGLATSSADWLPVGMKQKDRIELAMKLYKLLVVLVGDDAKRRDYLLEDPDFMQRALRLIYELETKSSNTGGDSLKPD